MKIKLSDLKAKRALMTPGPYEAGGYDTATRAEVRAPGWTVASTNLHPLDHLQDAANAAGIAATDSAVDLLIEIVDTLKRLDRWHPDHGDIPTLRAKLDAALEKVEL